MSLPVVSPTSAGLGGVISSNQQAVAAAAAATTAQQAAAVAAQEAAELRAKETGIAQTRGYAPTPAGLGVNPVAVAPAESSLGDVLAVALKPVSPQALSDQRYYSPRGQVVNPTYAAAGLETPDVVATRKVLSMVSTPDVSKSQKMIEGTVQVAQTNNATQGLLETGLPAGEMQSFLTGSIKGTLLSTDYLDAAGVPLYSLSQAQSVYAGVGGYGPRGYPTAARNIVWQDTGVIVDKNFDEYTKNIVGGKTVYTPTGKNYITETNAAVEASNAGARAQTVDPAYIASQNLANALSTARVYAANNLSPQGATLAPGQIAQSANQMAYQNIISLGYSNPQAASILNLNATQAAAAAKNPASLSYGASTQKMNSALDIVRALSLNPTNKINPNVVGIALGEMGFSGADIATMNKQIAAGQEVIISIPGGGDLTYYNTPAGTKGPDSYTDLSRLFKATGATGLINGVLYGAKTQGIYQETVPKTMYEEISSWFASAPGLSYVYNLGAGYRKPTVPAGGPLLSPVRAGVDFGDSILTGIATGLATQANVEKSNALSQYANNIYGYYNKAGLIQNGTFIGTPEQYGQLSSATQAATAAQALAASQQQSLVKGGSLTENNPYVGGALKTISSLPFASNIIGAGENLVKNATPWYNQNVVKPYEDWITGLSTKRGYSKTVQSDIGGAIAAFPGTAFDFGTTVASGANYLAQNVASFPALAAAGVLMMGENAYQGLSKNPAGFLTTQALFVLGTSGLQEGASYGYGLARTVGKEPLDINAIGYEPQMGYPVARGIPKASELEASFKEGTFIPKPTEMRSAIGGPEVPYVPESTHLPTQSGLQYQLWTGWESGVPLANKAISKIAGGYSLKGGESELEGIYGAPGIQTYFTKYGVTPEMAESPKIKFSITGIKAPGIVNTLVENVRAVPESISEKTMALKAAGQSNSLAYKEMIGYLNTFVSENPDTSTAFFPRTKGEYEALIPLGSRVKVNPTRYYTKLGGIGADQWFGLRVPITEQEVIGGYAGSGIETLDFIGSGTPREYYGGPTYELSTAIYGNAAGILSDRGLTPTTEGNALLRQSIGGASRNGGAGPARSQPIEDYIINDKLYNLSETYGYSLPSASYRYPVSELGKSLASSALRSGDSLRSYGGKSYTGLSSPGLSSPALSSPGLSSPGLSSPGLSSPGLSSPGGSSPGGSYGNEYYGTSVTVPTIPTIEITPRYSLLDVDKLFSLKRQRRKERYNPFNEYLISLTPREIAGTTPQFKSFYRTVSPGLVEEITPRSQEYLRREAKTEQEFVNPVGPNEEVMQNARDFFRTATRSERKEVGGPIVTRKQAPTDFVRFISGSGALKNINPSSNVRSPARSSGFEAAVFGGGGSKRSRSNKRWF